MEVLHRHHPVARWRLGDLDHMDAFAVLQLVLIIMMTESVKPDWLENAWLREGTRTGASMNSFLLPAFASILFA